MRQRLAAAASVTAIALAAGGCVSGTPPLDQAKAAARSWATAHLRPSMLEVTSVIVTRDEHRAKVKLVADGRNYVLGLLRPGDEWLVASARRTPAR
jgi:hypothetical protein